MRARLNRRDDGTHAAIGLGATALFLLVAMLSYSQVFVHLLSPQSGQSVTARFADTAELKVNDPVRVNGVQDGLVQAITLDPGGRTTTVKMLVSGPGLPIYANAHAAVSERNLLGGSFYIALDRGTPSAGVIGDRTIPLSHTHGQIEIEDITSLIENRARQGLQILPGQLATALQPSTILQQPLQALSATSPEIAAGLSAVRGQAPDTDLKQLIRATNQTLAGLDTPNDAIREFIGGAAATLQATGDQATNIEKLFAQAPAVEDQAQETLPRLSTTLHDADPLVVSLQRSAASVAPTLTDFRPPVEQTNDLLHNAVPLLNSLTPASRYLSKAASSGTPVLSALNPSLKLLADEILPTFNTKYAETKLTPAESIGPFFALWGGAAAQVDQNGHMFRFPASAGEGALSNDLPCQLYLTNPSKGQLVTCDNVAQALQTYFSYNPLATPPSGGTPTDLNPQRKADR